MLYLNYESVKQVKALFNWKGLWPWNKTRGAQKPGTRVPWRVNFVERVLFFCILIMELVVCQSSGA